MKKMQRARKVSYVISSVAGASHRPADGTIILLRTNDELLPCTHPRASPMSLRKHTASRGHCSRGACFRWHGWSSFLWNNLNDLLENTCLLLEKVGRTFGVNVLQVRREDRAGALTARPLALVA